MTAFASIIPDLLRDPRTRPSFADMPAAVQESDVALYHNDVATARTHMRELLNGRWRELKFAHGPATEEKAGHYIAVLPAEKVADFVAMWCDAAMVSTVRGVLGLELGSMGGTKILVQLHDRNERVGEELQRVRTVLWSAYRFSETPPWPE